jgi:hypothetical protein
MTTLVRLAKRSQGLSIDDFQRQAGAGCDWSSAVPYGLRAATRALTLAGADRRGAPACDAIDELVFDDEASVVRCLADAAFRRAWGSGLLDSASVACLVVEEHVAKPGPVTASFVKNYELVTKRPGGRPARRRSTAWRSPGSTTSPRCGRAPGPRPTPRPGPMSGTSWPVSYRS